MLISTAAPVLNIRWKIYFHRFLHSVMDILTCKMYYLLSLSLRTWKKFLVELLLLDFILLLVIDLLLLVFCVSLFDIDGKSDFLLSMLRL